MGEDPVAVMPEERGGQGSQELGGLQLERKAGRSQWVPREASAGSVPSFLPAASSPRFCWPPILPPTH